jgi:hypothetical protein
MHGAYGEAHLGVQEFLLEVGPVVMADHLIAVSSPSRGETVTLWPKALPVKHRDHLVAELGRQGYSKDFENTSQKQIKGRPASGLAGWTPRWAE